MASEISTWKLKSCNYTRADRMLILQFQHCDMYSMCRGERTNTVQCVRITTLGWKRAKSKVRSWLLPPTRTLPKGVFFSFCEVLVWSSFKVIDTSSRQSVWKKDSSPRDTVSGKIWCPQFSSATPSIEETQCLRKGCRARNSLQAHCTQLCTGKWRLPTDQKKWPGLFLCLEQY